jgi:hypothetical protein
MKEWDKFKTLSIRLNEAKEIIPVWELDRAFRAAFYGKWRSGMLLEGFEEMNWQLVVDWCSIRFVFICGRSQK